MTRTDAEFDAALSELLPHLATSARVEVNYARADVIFVIAAIHLALRHPRLGKSAEIKRAGDMARRMGQCLAAEVPEPLAWAVEEMVRRGESPSYDGAPPIVHLAWRLARTVTHRAPQVVTHPGAETPETLRQMITDAAPSAAVLCPMGQGWLVALSEAEAAQLREKGATVAPSSVPPPPGQERDPSGAPAQTLGSIRPQGEEDDLLIHFTGALAVGDPQTAVQLVRMALAKEAAPHTLGDALRRVAADGEVAEEVAELERAEAALRRHAGALREAVLAKVLRVEVGARCLVSTSAPDLLGHEPLEGLRHLVRQVGGEILKVLPGALSCRLAPDAYAKLAGCAAAFGLVIEEDVQHQPQADGAAR